MVITTLSKSCVLYLYYPSLIVKIIFSISSVENEFQVQNQNYTFKLKSQTAHGRKTSLQVENRHASGHARAHPTEELEYIFFAQKQFIFSFIVTKNSVKYTKLL